MDWVLQILWEHGECWMCDRVWVGLVYVGSE